MIKIDMKIILLGIICLLLSDIFANYAQLSDNGIYSIKFENFSYFILAVGIVISIVGYLYPIYRKFNEKNNDNK